MNLKISKGEDKEAKPLSKRGRRLHAIAEKLSNIDSRWNDYDDGDRPRMREFLNKSGFESTAAILVEISGRIEITDCARKITLETGMIGCWDISNNIRDGKKTYLNNSIRKYKNSTENRRFKLEKLKKAVNLSLSILDDHKAAIDPLVKEAEKLLSEK